MSTIPVKSGKSEERSNNSVLRNEQRQMIGQDQARLHKFQQITQKEIDQYQTLKEQRKLKALKAVSFGLAVLSSMVMTAVAVVMVFFHYHWIPFAAFGVVMICGIIKSRIDSKIETVDEKFNESAIFQRMFKSQGIDAYRPIGKQGICHQEEDISRLIGYRSNRDIFSPLFLIRPSLDTDEFDTKPVYDLDGVDFAAKGYAANYFLHPDFYNEQHQAAQSVNKQYQQIWMQMQSNVENAKNQGPSFESLWQRYLDEKTELEQKLQQLKVQSKKAEEKLKSTIKEQFPNRDADALAKELKSKEFDVTRHKKNGTKLADIREKYQSGKKAIKSKKNEIKQQQEQLIFKYQQEAVELGVKKYLSLADHADKNIKPAGIVESYARSDLAVNASNWDRVELFKSYEPKLEIIHAEFLLQRYVALTQFVSQFELQLNHIKRSKPDEYIKGQQFLQPIKNDLEKASKLINDKITVQVSFPALADFDQAAFHHGMVFAIQKKNSPEYKLQRLLAYMCVPDAATKFPHLAQLANDINTAVKKDLLASLNKHALTVRLPLNSKDDILKMRITHEIHFMERWIVNFKLPIPASHAHQSAFIQLIEQFNSGVTQLKTKITQHDLDFNQLVKQSNALVLQCMEIRSKFFSRSSLSIEDLFEKCEQLISEQSHTIDRDLIVGYKKYKTQYEEYCHRNKPIDDIDNFHFELSEFARDMLQLQFCEPVAPTEKTNTIVMIFNTVKDKLKDHILSAIPKKEPREVFHWSTNRVIRHTQVDMDRMEVALSADLTKMRILGVAKPLIFRFVVMLTLTIVMTIFTSPWIGIGVACGMFLISNGTLLVEHVLKKIEERRFKMRLQQRGLGQVKIGEVPGNNPSLKRLVELDNQHDLAAPGMAKGNLATQGPEKMSSLPWWSVGRKVKKSQKFVGNAAKIEIANRRNELVGKQIAANQADDIAALEVQHAHLKRQVAKQVVVEDSEEIQKILQTIEQKQAQIEKLREPEVQKAALEKQIVDLLIENKVYTEAILKKCALSDKSLTEVVHQVEQLNKQIAGLASTITSNQTTIDQLYGEIKKIRQDNNEALKARRRAKEEEDYLKTQLDIVTSLPEKLRNRQPLPGPVINEENVQWQKTKAQLKSELKELQINFYKPKANKEEIRARIKEIHAELNMIYEKESKFVEQNLKELNSSSNGKEET